MASKLHANTSIPRNDVSWNSIESATPFGTMPQQVIQSAYPSFTMGNCTLMQAVKQPEHGRVLTTGDWNILLTDELQSKFNFVRFNYSL